MTIELFIPFIFFFLALVTYSLRDKNVIFREKLEIASELKQELQIFKVREAALRQVMAEFDKQLMNCLLVRRKETTPSSRPSSLDSFNTYVQILPNGEENGRFLGLRLEGTDCRIVAIRIKLSKIDEIVERFRIPFELMGKSTNSLFDFIAKQVSSFIDDNGLKLKTLHLGFLCDFPVYRESLSVAKLKHWTHGFHCSGGVGRDIVRLLKDAIIREKLYNVKVVGFLDDVTGTLVDCHWNDQNCVIGLKLDESTNAAYVERCKNIAGFDGEHDIPYTVVNTQWANFGDNGELDFVTSQWDRGGLQKGGTEVEIFDKMVAPRHMAELFRVLMLRFAKKNILFGGTESTLLNTRGSVTPRHLYQIESEVPGNFDNCKNVLQNLEIHAVTDKDCANVRYICEKLTTRSASLVAAALAALIDRTPFQKVTVGVEGGLHKCHPYYHERLENAVTKLANPGKIIEIKAAVDGKGRGAALLAACYTRYYRHELVV